MAWQHDHTECVKHVPVPRKVYRQHGGRADFSYRTEAS